MFARNRLGCRMQVSRARVVTQALPGMEHIVFRSVGESNQIGKSPKPLIIIWDNGGDLRLLEHELGNEDSIGIGPATPGEVATVVPIPAQERASEGSDVFLRDQDLLQTLNAQRPTLNSEDY